MLFRTIVDRGVSKRKRNDSFPGFPLTSLLDCFQCVRHDEHISRGSLGSAVPPFGCAFSTARGMQGVLAVANEEGIVRLYNTENRKSPVLQEWMAHENAVFDIAWVPGEASLVTASGDQMAKLWDVKSQNLLGTFKGHQCSVKSVSFTQQEKSVFCSGGRDGNIMIWDTRCSKKDGFYRQVKQISGAHNKMDAHTPSQMKKKRLGQRGRAPSVDSQQSVTVVLFCDEHTLISTGAVDGIIKMWDLRKNYTAHLHDPTPLLAYPYPGASTRKLGYSGLVLDSSGANLFANCTDDNLYMFNISGVKTSPVAVFSGHRNSSFYVKSTISPDDQFLASGSSDHHTYIWKISEPKQAPVMLQGHSQEVTSIAWCPTDFTKIASCSDDNTVRIWRLDRGMGGAKSSVGEANLVGWACSGPTSTLSSSRPLNQAEHTPSKNLRTDPLESLSSPLPAACAPSVAALPLPSTTSSPTQTQGAKAIRPHLRTPTSIRQWCSRATPRDKASPPLRQVLSPCPQSPVPGTPPSERRAKRRLVTGSGTSGSCGGMRNCDCVTELYPTAKRSRPLLGVCCAQEGSTTETEKILEAGELRMGEQKLSNRADKENSSLEVVDWLSVMGRMLKEGTGSPNSPKSPGASKRPDGRTPPSLSYSPNPMKKISSYFQRVNPN